MASDQSSSSAAAALRAPLARLHALPDSAPPLGAPLPPQSGRGFVPLEDTRFGQHRCFPRLSDAAFSVTDFSLPLGEFASRAAALARCLHSAAGDEPAEPPLLRAADEYRLRYRPGRGPPPPAAAPR